MNWNYRLCLFSLCMAMNSCALSMDSIEQIRKSVEALGAEVAGLKKDNLERADRANAIDKKLDSLIELLSSSTNVENRSENEKLTKKLLEIKRANAEQKILEIANNEQGLVRRRNPEQLALLEQLRRRIISQTTPAMFVATLALGVAGGIVIYLCTRNTKPLETAAIDLMGHSAHVGGRLGNIAIGMVRRRYGM